MIKTTKDIIREFDELFNSKATLNEVNVMLNTKYITKKYHDKIIKLLKYRIRKLNEYLNKNSEGNENE